LICLSNLQTVSALIVGFQAALSRRLGGKITHEGHIAVRDRRRRQFKQQAGLGLPIFCARMPEIVMAHLVETFRQYLKKEAAEELNTLYPFSLPLARVMILVL